MTAFEKAVRAGYGIELDVQKTRDGKLIVHHDPTTNRVCGVSKVIAETDYAQLPALPDGSHIPLFEEVLRLVAGRVPLIVEVKQYGSPAQNAEATWQFLKDYQGKYCVESFHPLAMLWFRKNVPQVTRGQLAFGDKENMKKQGFVVSHALKYLLVNVLSRPHFIAYCVPQDRNLSMRLMKRFYKPILACWTVRDQATLDYAYKEGYRYLIFEKFTPNVPTKE